MASTQTALNDTSYSGTRDGEQIIWSYRSSEDTATKQLFWTKTTSPAQDNKWKELGSERIITIIPDKLDQTNFSIITTSEEQSSGASDETQTVLKTYKIRNPPPDLVEIYQLPKDSYISTLTSFHIIISVTSGIGKAQHVWEGVVQPFLDLLKSAGKIGSYEAHFTTSEHSITELTETMILPEAEKGKQQLIVVMSGDGGVIDVLNALLSKPQSSAYRRPALNLIPLGTGNALANSSGILNDKTIGLRTLLHGRPKGLPMFRATFSSGARHLVDEARQEKQLRIVDGQGTVYGAVVCSWGLHASLVADSDTTEYRKFGAQRFQMAAKENLYPADGSPPHAYKGNLSIMRSGSNEWVKVDRETHGYLLATLVSNLEAGFTINPFSKPLDGVLRIVHFGPISGAEAMEVMTKAYQGGKHVDDERVSYEAVSGIRIDFAEEDGHWRRVCIDGKIVRVERNGWVEVKTDIEPVVDLVVF